ncbi:kinase-like domain-containing protein, partial [Obelidium mucronatum]
VYSDLKLDNILMCADGHIKLADYGICKGKMGFNQTTKTYCGTAEYMAPEIIQGGRYTRAVDWWGFGVLFFASLKSRNFV